jgi:AbiJ N-terminal domain 4
LLPPIYSRRKRQADATGPDVYTYISIPSNVRVQVIHMLEAGLGQADRPTNMGGSQLNPCYEHIVKFMRLELGVHRLAGDEHHEFQQELFFWLEQESNIDHWLDGVEISLQTMKAWMSEGEYRSVYRPSATPDAVIAEFNARLLDAAVGYQYVSGEIIRIDSKHLHSEVVLPVLHLLRGPGFASANSEYRNAHEAFRHGGLEDCLVDCGKALESVLKVIGRKRGWQFNDTDPASKLIQAAVDGGFLAAYSQAALNHLKGLIESSTPTVRNKMGAHGAGTSPRVIPQHLAAFQLHQTAAVILYLAEQDAALP